ncbi:MAG: AbrB/MazE/SpoVT family DNA-binding domain-containing protein [Candidatus Heimdallarchaeota archaeon]
MFRWNFHVERIQSTIPKSFIENLDLSPDDEVTLIYKDENTLIISTKND